MRAFERTSRDLGGSPGPGPAVAAIAVGMLAFCAALFGILTRPLGLFAAIWPANALLVGLFVRRRDLARPMNWMGAVLGLLLAGEVAGDSYLENLGLTAANMAGVLVGFQLLRRLDPEDAALRRPLSTLYLLVICAAAAFASAVVGSSQAAARAGLSLPLGFAFWFATELCNYAIVLPVLLAVPDDLYRRTTESARRIASDRERIAPLAALAFSITISILVGGAGAIAFSVPALLWCSLSYGLFPTSLLLLTFSVTMMGAQSLGLLVTADHPSVLIDMISFRLGIALMTMGPLTVSSITIARKEVIARLDRANSLDSLTLVLARHAYLDRTTQLLEDPERLTPRGVAVMMIDIDHFKQVNDLHGHAAGDAVLVGVTEAIGAELRKTDLFGRVGGEEFAITLYDIGHDNALAMAERLRIAVENKTITIPDKPPLKVTISIGIVHRGHDPSAGLPTLLPLADAALYRAKAAGRNRVVASDEPEMKVDAPA